MRQGQRGVLGKLGGGTTDPSLFIHGGGRECERKRRVLWAELQGGIDFKVGMEWYGRLFGIELTWEDRISHLPPLRAPGSRTSGSITLRLAASKEFVPLSIHLALKRKRL